MLQVEALQARLRLRKEGLQGDMRVIQLDQTLGLSKSRARVHLDSQLTRGWPGGWCKTEGELLFLACAGKDEGAFLGFHIPGAGHLQTHPA